MGELLMCNTNSGQPSETQPLIGLLEAFFILVISIINSNENVLKPVEVRKLI